METPSSPSSAITAPPNYHETTVMFAKLATEAMTCHFSLLHYDSLTMTRERKFRHRTSRSTAMNANFDIRAAYVPPAAEERRTQRQQCILGGIRQPIRLIGMQDAHLIDVGIELPSITLFEQYSLIEMDCLEEHKKPSPIQMEWTWREQTELMAKVDSSIGDGITALQAMHASRSKANDELPYPGLFRRGAKATVQAEVEMIIIDG
ncbi:hypothetical protein DFH29DRAFT_880205 [Suillus ampliporus]|nr:hypothetical protein DFH29DRAFT_880205 [Suillus ampliporus]